jgi:three-Cys-motif partner protein
MSDLEIQYGEHADQVDPFFKEKREWSKTKDRILGTYIACYLKTVHRRHSPIIIVDAFAGPGKFGDGTDGSPLIICHEIDRASERIDVGIGCVFADNRPSHRRALEASIASYIQRGLATVSHSGLPRNDRCPRLQRRPTVCRSKNAQEDGVSQ